MLQLAVAVALPGAIFAPHLLPLYRVGPVTAAAAWMLALTLRALVAVGGALFLFVYLPQIDLFRAVSEWCLHQVIPVITAHLGFSGHSFAHAAAILPGLALAASVIWLLFALARGWLALRRQLRRSLGEGPRGSTVVADDGILVAATGLGRRRIVVSRGALGAMDSDELEASLAHERGHLLRRHRPLLLLGSLLAALGRPLPGTAAAERELAFSLERDADQYAVRETRDPLALASAICKAAGATPHALTALSGRGRVSHRLEPLVDGSGQGPSAVTERSARVLVAVLAAITLGLTVTLPSWALAAPADGDGNVAHCHH